MINWQEKLTTENFYLNPVPHFRVYDLIDIDIHNELYEEYQSIISSKILLEDHRHGFTQGTSYMIWRPNKPQPLSPNMSSLLHSLTGAQDDVFDAYNRLAKCNLSPTFDSTDSVNFNFWHRHAFIPGELVYDYHRDGEDLKFVSIYYLGMGDEESGDIEIKNEETQEEISYEYTANSYILFLNEHPQKHRFRHPSNGRDRRTLNTAFPAKHLTN